MKKVLIAALAGAILFAAISIANAGEEPQNEEFTISPTELPRAARQNIEFVNTITTNSLGTGINPNQPPEATRTVIDLPKQFKINNTTFPYCQTNEAGLQNTTVAQAKDACGTGSLVSDDPGTRAEITVGTLSGSVTLPFKLTVFNEDDNKLLIHMSADTLFIANVLVGKLVDSTAGSAYGKALDITIPDLAAGGISLFKLTIPANGYIQANCNPSTFTVQETTYFSDAPTSTDDHSISLGCTGPPGPDALLRATPDLVSIGERVTFDASESFTDDGSFSWDLNGDGKFERDTGKSDVTTKTYDDRGVRKVGVRITNSQGRSDEAFAVVSVKPLGVSIEDGATYTNDPNVSIRAVYVPDADNATISNDGGFGDAETVAAKPSLNWKLASNGPERLPKAVYVRFSGGSATDTTYTDDIILDETAPVVESASISGSARTSPATASSRGQRTLRIIAKDRTSGVKRMQIASNKKKPSEWRKFRPRSPLNGAVDKVFVRVRDRAGNASGWKRAK